jgi:hypothetical protein
MVNAMKMKSTQPTGSQRVHDAGNGQPELLNEALEEWAV